MASIRSLLRRLTGRPEPATPGTGQRIQAREQAAARLRLLQSNQARESRWSGR
ncbi:hypothetical protein O7622_01315 [Micromonospora sp. WMMD1076]|uniref:hypothetical protein n=1 Tax=Micromonospora sp. WMMD1076 TaxID=3016103 RepID=UPI00249A6F0D|nr:hypothetical protein [Micromonospora sp. WMMD1076]WFF07270.1 hypothetical protein O7622_01315 [Micromonospora sp. WMMD1076]